MNRTDETSQIKIAGSPKKIIVISNEAFSELHFSEIDGEVRNLLLIVSKVFDEISHFAQIVFSSKQRPLRSK
jgi:hypothetical protein